MNATSRPSSALQLIHAPSRSESTQEPLDSLEFPSPPTALQMPDQTASGQPNRSDLPPELWAEIAKYVATTYEDDESRRKTLRALSRTCRNSEREAKRRYAPCRELICENISLQSEDDVEELRHCVEAAKGENLAAKRLRGIKSICIDGTVRDQRWVSSLMSEDCWMRQIITELVVLYGIDLSGMSREDFHELFSSFQSVCLKLDGVRFKDGDALTSLFYVADVMQIIVEDVAAVTCDSASESVESVESEDQRSESEPLHEGIRYLDIMVTSLEDVARVRDRTWENTIRSLLVQETTVTVFFPKLDPFTTSEGSYHFDFKPTIDSLRELQGQYGDAASESKILEFVGYNSPQSCAAKVLFFTQADTPGTQLTVSVSKAVLEEKDVRALVEFIEAVVLLTPPVTRVKIECNLGETLLNIVEGAHHWSTLDDSLCQNFINGSGSDRLVELKAYFTGRYWAKKCWRTALQSLFPKWKESSGRLACHRQCTECDEPANETRQSDGNSRKRFLKRENAVLLAPDTL